MFALCCATSRIGPGAPALVRRLLVAAAFLFLAIAGTGARAQATGTAVEYYHAGFNHYFITSFASEIAALDSGAFGGVWTRTGQTIAVWSEAGAQTSGACRLFTGTTYAPKSSHFYTPYAHECEALKVDPKWQYEGIAFHLNVSATGVCPSDTAPLYRLYNNAMSGAPNHRYTASRAIFDQMRSQAWTPEGAGPAIVFACIPGSTQAVAGSGYWTGTTSAGEQLAGAMFDDGSFYFVYGTEGTMGLVDGKATFAGASFAAPQARDLVMRPRPAEYVANVSGTTAAQATMNGTIATSERTRTFAASYAGETGAAVSPGQLTGTYDGVASSQEGSIEVLLAVSPSGALSGSQAGCTITGTLVPRGNTGVADATVVHGGANCALDSASTTGIAIYVPIANGLLIVTQSADADDVFVFVGVK